MAVEVARKPTAAPAPDVESRPVVIEAREVEKTFLLPTQRVDSLKEMVLHPLSRRGAMRELHALRDVSFEVHQGEFFGIIGRNGSGKSTLLKILASIYGADSGTIRMTGQPAPFIELGVGFNTDLTARENVDLNGVMMGLTRREARSRLDAVLDFAELEEFVDMKLKNYSSGMLVRLAFSVMIQSDAEILLIDEVLAVGDAAFQQKCADVFHEMRDAGRTVVLVTHDMQAVEHYCDRAMLLDHGRIEKIGDPAEVARSYLRLNFARAPDEGDEDFGRSADVQLTDAWLEGPDGERIATVEHGQELQFTAELEATREISRPTFGFMITNADGVDVFGFGVALDEEQWPDDRLSPGDRVRVTARIDNELLAARYFIRCWVHRDHSYTNLVLFSPHVLDFVVYGDPGVTGLVALKSEFEATRIEGSGE